MKIFGHSKKKQYLCTRFRKRYVSRSRAVVARQAHNLKVGGSIPPSATRMEVEIVSTVSTFFCNH